MSHVDGNGTPKYWTSIADRDGDPAVRALQEREFRTPSETPTEIPSRRDFLKLLSAGAAFAPWTKSRLFGSGKTGRLRPGA